MWTILLCMLFVEVRFFLHNLGINFRAREFVFASRMKDEGSGLG